MYLLRTGYDDIRGLWKDTFGDAIIDTAGEVWGLDHERELKGVYRPTGHPGVSLKSYPPPVHRAYLTVVVHSYGMRQETSSIHDGAPSSW
jgi:hypothetical protein